MDGNTVTSLVSILQCLTICCMKKFYLIHNLHLPWWILRLVPHNFYFYCLFLLHVHPGNGLQNSARGHIGAGRSCSRYWLRDTWLRERGRDKCSRGCMTGEEEKGKLLLTEVFQSTMTTHPKTPPKSQIEIQKGLRIQMTKCIRKMAGKTTKHHHHSWEFIRWKGQMSGEDVSP